DSLEEYGIWFTTDSLERQSIIRDLYVFENGEVTTYNRLHSLEERNDPRLTIEEFNELSDEEVIQRAKDSVKTSPSNSNSTIQSGEYTFDYIMDNVGQSVEKIEVHLNNYVLEERFDFEYIQEERVELGNYTYDKNASEEEQFEAYTSYQSD